jgi:vitamin B12 transporter
MATADHAARQPAVRGFLRTVRSVENLFDEKYQTSAGYGTWGRSAFIGARVRY